MKGNKGYVLDKGFLGLVNGDCELFSDEKEYDEYLKNIRENHKLPKSYQENYNAITTGLLKLFIKEKENGNIVFSPFSILTLLGMAASATAGDACNEILSAIFEGTELQTALSTLKKVSGHFLKSGSLSSANAVCIQPELHSAIRPEYEGALTSDFDGRLFMTNGMVQDVNKWVSQATKGMINEVLDESNENVLACLLNAIAFDADWKFPYEDDDIYDGEFTGASGVVRECKMLNSEEDWYIENETIKGFVKLYKDKEYCFMALLPKDRSKRAFSNVIEGLNLSEIYDSAERETVYVTLPEYRYAFEEDLTDILIKKGISKVFTIQADFSPMTTSKLKIDSILHKVFIDVSRKGTRAAAVTECVVVAGGCPDFKTVTLDRPFIYAIIHQATVLPVFCGIVNDIKEDR